MCLCSKMHEQQVYRYFKAIDDIMFCSHFSQLYYTYDFGDSFTLLQTNVKSFAWSSGDGIPVHLYIERKEPSSM